MTEREGAIDQAEPEDNDRALLAAIGEYSAARRARPADPDRIAAAKAEVERLEVLRGA